MSGEVLRLRLAEHFDLQPVHSSRPMKKTDASAFSFLVVDRDGLQYEARARVEGLFTAQATDDLGRLDAITMLERGVVQGVLGLSGADFTLGKGDCASTDAAGTQLILESVSVDEFVCAAQSGRIMPTQSIDFPSLIPAGALMWSLQEYEG